MLILNYLLIYAILYLAASQKKSLLIWRKILSWTEMSNRSKIDSKLGGNNKTISWYSMKTIKTTTCRDMLQQLLNLLTRHKLLCFKTSWTDVMDGKKDKVPP